MTSTKYLSYIYKITTKEDNLRLFIGSTRENLQTLLLFFIRDLNTERKNKLYNWIRPLNSSKLKINLIKSYPVIDKEDQRKREKYWIDKYKSYGYDVLHNPFKYENKEKLTSKIYICLENVTMESVIKKYGDKIISISRNGFSPSTSSLSTSDTRNISPSISESIDSKSLIRTLPSSIKNIPQKSLPDNSGEDYINELKNMLLMRQSSRLSISELAKQNKTKLYVKTNKIVIPKKITVSKKIEKIDFLTELKKKIKRID